MTEHRITSWEQLATYAASRDPEERALAVACIEAQRAKFPDQISNDDVLMVKAAAYMNRKARRVMIALDRKRTV